MPITGCLFVVFSALDCPCSLCSLCLGVLTKESVRITPLVLSALAVFFMSERVVAEVNLSAIVSNLTCVRREAPSSKVLAMVKANAYGLGAFEVASALVDYVDGFGVATLAEAVDLRQQGFVIPILLLSGVHSEQELAMAQQYQLELVVHSQAQLDMLSSQPSANITRIWLKLDTGMHRLGFSSDEYLAAKESVAKSQANAELMLMTHLACADEFNHKLTQEQLFAFKSVTDELSVPRSVANSAAILSLPEAHCEWVRPGIMLYGVSPFGLSSNESYGLIPAMTLKASVIAIKQVPTGESVGYGAGYVCQKPTSIAVVSIGYGDGYPRSAISGTPCFINGVETHLVGRVSMDMLTIDITDLANVAIGDEVELWGENVLVERVAECSNTIGYELLTGLSNRVAFKYYS